MDLVPWGLIGLGVVLGAAPLTQGRRRVDPRRLDRVAAKHGLPLPDHLRGAVADRLAARERSAVRWGLVGLAAGLILAVVLDRALPGESTLAPLGLLGGTIGASLGSYTGLTRRTTTLDPTAPRIARARSTDLDDYVTAPELWAVRLVPVVVAVAAVVAVGVWTLLPLRPSGGALVPLVVTAAALAVVGVWALLRRAADVVLDQPQPARDDLGLAWDDVLRTTALREVVDTAVGVGLVATLGLLAVAGMWVVDPAVRAAGMDRTLTLGLVAGAVGVACWSVLLVLWVVGRVRRTPSRDLWRDPSATGA